MTTFGDKIRKLRKEKKMTQQKLGDMVGVSHRTIRSWEVEITSTTTGKDIHVASMDVEATVVIKK